MWFLSTLVATFALTRVANGLTSGLEAVDAFVSVSSDVAMYVYVPTTKIAKPPIVVAIHSCERTAGYYFDNTGYASLADVYGYIVIYPNSSALEECWDTSSPQATTHYGGGQSQAIANMVSYATTNLNGDASRVFVTGSSSGGIMVNLLAGVYPEVFKAASVFSGLYSGAIFPYSGVRPKMLIWHGTIDAKYPYTPSFTDELNGWSSVLDVSFSHNVTNTPQGGYTKMIYGDGTELVGISAAGVGHTVPVDAVTDLSWFCIFPECELAGSPPASSSTSSSSSTTSSSSTSTSSSTTSTTSSTSSTTTSSTSSSTSVTSSSTSVGTTSSSAASSSLTSTASNTIASETSSPTTSASPIAVAHSGLSTGTKAGVGIASAAGALFLLVSGVFLIRRRRQNQPTEPESAIASNESQGHETHPGYGAVAGIDAALGDDRDGADKLHRGNYVQSTSTTNLLSPGLDHDRPMSTSTSLFPGGDQDRPTSTVESFAYTHGAYQGHDTPEMSEISLNGVRP